MSLSIDKGIAGPGLLAQIVIDKYAKTINLLESHPKVLQKQ